MPADRSRSASKPARCCSVGRTARSIARMVEGAAPAVGAAHIWARSPATLAPISRVTGPSRCKRCRCSSVSALMRRSSGKRMVRSASCIAQIRSWMALSRSRERRGHGGRARRLIRSIACAKAVRNSPNTLRCDASGTTACSIRSTNASASAAADVPLQRSAAESGAVAVVVASLTWFWIAGRLRGARRSSAAEAAKA